MGDEEKMKAVNQLVTAMVKENYSLDEIAKELSNSDDPAEKMWAQSYGKTAPTTSPANLSILDRAKKHLEETSGYQLAAEGIGLAVTPPIATHLGRRIIDKILPSPGVLVAEEQLKNRIGVPPTDGGPPPPPGSPPGGPSAEPSELDKARLQREQHNMEIARQRALRETAATDLALAKAEAQKAKLAAQQAAPTFKDPTAQRLFEISQAQQAAKAQPMMGQTLLQPSTSGTSVPPTAATTQTPDLTTGRPNPYMSAGTTSTSLETTALAPTETTKQEPPKLKRAEQTAINEVNKAKNQYLNLFGYQAKAPDSARSIGAVDAYNNMVEKQFGGVPPRNIPNDPIRPVGLPGGYQQYVEFLNRNYSELPSATQEFVNKSRTKGQVGNVEKLIAAGVPLSQQGSAGAKSMAGLVGLAGLTALSSSPEARAAMGRAQSAIQDLGISPDIFAGKGEEMGRLGKGYVTAGNPQYRAQIAEQLKVEKDPERRQLLLEEFQKAGGSGAGRGVAPPSAYMR
jgi:hypothetical protein